MSSFLTTSSISYGKGGKSCIKVGIRIRPRSSKEINKNDPLILFSMEPSTIILNDNEKEKKYSGYDYVLNEYVTQCQLYKKMIKDYIPQLLSGYNCTIFAYGQTGTGKTFTMEGKSSKLDYDNSFKWDSNDDTGITLRSMEHIFTILNTPTCTRKSITITYVELYNEEVYDLLGDDISKKLKIFDNTKNSEGVCIKDVKEFTVENMQEVYKLLKRGISMRQTAATTMNHRSSRSHAVFTAVVIWDELIGDKILTRKGKINFVDLAGSENIGKSGATKESAREAGNINTSLLALGQVINALTEKSSHIPYRSSKLTRILKDSLGGSALTCLIATVSPTMSNKGETISTLEYGLKAMNVENDIRANVRTQKDQFSLNYKIINDYIQVVNIVLNNSVQTANHNKLLALLDKDLFSKIDKFILKKDNIFEESHKWFSNNTSNLYKFQEQLNSQTKLLKKHKLTITNTEDKIKLLEDEVKKKLSVFEQLKTNLVHFQRTNSNSQNELFHKIIILEKKNSQAKELCEEERNFLYRYLKNIENSLTKCMELREETILEINHEFEETILEHKSKCNDIIKQNDTELKNTKEIANKLLNSNKNDYEFILNNQNLQDQYVELFNIKKNEFFKIISQKFDELNILQKLNIKLNLSCEKQLNECNNIIGNEIKLFYMYIKEMNSLVKLSIQSKTSMELKNYITEIEEINF
uniref:Kinesin-like protein n=1 Tax=Strongyloides stercoralis TaxID=6248 RepID=A0A0K0EID3_STRER